jgi:hypothetical protein
MTGRIAIRRDIKIRPYILQFVPTYICRMIARDKKKFEEIKAKLLSKDQKQVLEGIDSLDEYPFPEVVEPLIFVYAQSQNTAVKQKLTEVLTTLKISGLEEFFLKAIISTELNSCRKDLLHFMWSSNVQPTHGWPSIIELAIGGSYEEIIEILSLLDNTEHEIEEAELLESVSILTTHLHENKDEPTRAIKTLLLQELNTRLQEG